MPNAPGLVRQPTAALAILLTAISRAEPDGGPLDARLSEEAAAFSEWDELLRLARRHHVSPLLCEALNRAGWPGVPDFARAELQARFSANLKRNFLLARQAMDALRSLSDAGVPVLAYRGVFMAESVYGRVSSREVVDIDLLIDAADERAARAVLESLKFKRAGKFLQQQIFRKQSLNIEIDLHWHLAPGFFPVHYDFRALWERAVTAQLGGLEYRTPAREDLLLMLCIQLAKDCWERQQRLVQLQKVCDIAEVLLRTPGMDWAALRRRALGQGLSRVLDFGLILATGLLQAPLPPGTAAEVESDGAAWSLARAACAMPFLAETAKPPEENSLLDARLRARQLIFYLRLRERQRDKWLYPAQALASMARQWIMGLGRKPA